VLKNVVLNILLFKKMRSYILVDIVINSILSHSPKTDEASIKDRNILIV